MSRRRQGPAAMDPSALEGFDAFYRSAHRRLERLGHLLAGSLAVGEELAQEALLATSLSWAEVQDPNAFARRVLVNKAASHTRRQIVARKHVGSYRGPTHDPEVDYLWDVISRLSPELRIVVVLRFYEDLTIEDIAAITDTAAGTVKSRLHRAMARLRRELR